MTLDKIIERQFEVAARELKSQASDKVMEPRFCGYSGDSLVFAASCELDGTASKNAAVLLYRKLLHKHDCDAYAISNESWFVTQSLPASSTAAERAAALDGPPPSEREDRQECLMIYAENRSGCAARVWRLERDPAGKIVRLIDQGIGPNTNFFSRFANLLSSIASAH